MEKELDLQEILKKAEAQTDFPDVPLDEFTPPTYEEWKENCIALLKGAPFDKKMYTKTYEGITFDPMYFRNTTEEILPRTSFPGMDDFLRGSSPTGYIKTPWGIAQACDETLPEDVEATAEQARRLSELSGLPVIMTAAREDICGGIKAEKLFPLKLQKKYF